MHDCLYRNRASGNRWGLFIDVDELLHLGGQGHKAMFSQIARELRRNNYSAATFGSVVYHPESCQRNAFGDFKFLYRAPLVFCENSPGDPNFCSPNGGRRKSLVHFESVSSLNVHSPVAPDHEVKVFNASVHWLKHVRGIPFVKESCLNVQSECNFSDDALSMTCASTRFGGKKFVCDPGLELLCRMNAKGSHTSFGKVLR